MQPTGSRPRFAEPLRRTLARNVAIAGAVGAALALRRHDLRLLLPSAVLASWFSLGGHYVEIAFLNRLRDRLPEVRLIQAGVRLLIWFAGGVLLYLGMATTAHALAVAAPPLNLCWYGGFALVAIELVVHALMAVRGVPSFYDGRR